MQALTREDEARWREDFEGLQTDKSGIALAAHFIGLALQRVEAADEINDNLNYRRTARLAHKEIIEHAKKQDALLQEVFQKLDLHDVPL